MKMTVNLYTHEKCPLSAIQRQIINKDPIICVIPRGDNIPDSVYTMLNTSEIYRKYVCVMNRFDIGRASMFLASFPNHSSLKVLMVIPEYKKNYGVRFAQSVVKQSTLLVRSRQLNIKNSKSEAPSPSHYTPR